MKKIVLALLVVVVGGCAAPFAPAAYDNNDLAFRPYAPNVVTPSLVGAPEIGRSYAAHGSSEAFSGASASSIAPYPPLPLGQTATQPCVGVCYGVISPVTGRPRNTYVRGYYRRDGTYVRPHTRSRRR